ncbi:MAG TPA: hopanoid-associated sugar epimerase [Thermoanaerobaculia bacterium]|jgi:dihydroflavonol-4-reductase
MDLVTGGTGFVGTHVVRAILAEGRSVRCLVRPNSRRDNLAGLPVEIVEGDLTDAASLARAFKAVGIDTVYHVAADYRLWAKDKNDLYRANVGGTSLMLEAASQARVRRVVYTSSVAALGLTDDGSPANEETPVVRDRIVGHYKRSKYDAERIALSWAKRGLPVVIVNPSTPVGERDLKPTPTGQMIVDFLNRKMPAYVDTGLNLIDVRDVARGHLLAAERGRVGERYILGNRDLTLKEILETLSRLSGLPAPTIRLPHGIPLVFGALSSAAARITGKPPRVSLDSVRMSMHRMFFDPGKAVRELGLPQTPVEEALARAVEWFRANGYVRTPSPPPGGRGQGEGGSPPRK